MPGIYNCRVENAAMRAATSSIGLLPVIRSGQLRDARGLRGCPAVSSDGRRRGRGRVRRRR
ncbi:MAG TPA: hypothetical protein VHU80_00645, partial [Polyangiaceae bacterium]|nr:hypothetical protein [Polyangiaceae bacterium]